jgi:hypothetical protein
MPKREHRAITLDDGEQGRLYAIWSGSGKRLIMTVWNPISSDHRQIQLQSDQVESLIEFLTETVANAPAER